MDKFYELKQRERERERARERRSERERERDRERERGIARQKGGQTDRQKNRETERYYFSPSSEYWEPILPATLFVCLFVCLVGFLTSSSTSRLYRKRVPRLTSGNFTYCHTRDRAGRP